MPSSGSSSSESESESSNGNVRRTRRELLVSDSGGSVDLPVDPALEIPVSQKDGDTGHDEPDGTKSDEYSFELSRRKSKKLRKLMFEGVLLMS
jgi:hypothetical protein